MSKDTHCRSRGTRGSLGSRGSSVALLSRFSLLSLDSWLAIRALQDGEEGSRFVDNLFVQHLGSVQYSVFGCVCVSEMPAATDRHVSVPRVQSNSQTNMYVCIRTRQDIISSYE